MENLLTYLKKNFFLHKLKIFNCYRKWNFSLHIALRTLNVEKDDEVLLPSFNFIAAANAILYCNAIPHFIDIDETNLFVDEIKLEKYLSKICKVKKNKTYNKYTNRIIKAAIPMYTFGHAGNVPKVIKVLKKFKIKIIEDAAEALGTFYKKNMQVHLVMWV